MALFSEFAEMCRQSKEWQGDGWGIRWQDDKGKWQRQKSLAPVWTTRRPNKEILKAKTFIIHARSASFKEQRGKVWHNQPYLENGVVFVFNGFLHGVSLHLPGETGAEKIFRFISKRIKTVSFAEALTKIHQLIRRNTKKVLGCNIGLTDGKKIAVLCDYDKDEEYYRLCYYQDKNTTLVCSEPLRPYKWQRMKKGEVKVF